MFGLYVSNLRICKYPNFDAAYEKMNAIMADNDYRLFRVDLNSDGDPIFSWGNHTGICVAVEIRRIQ